MDIATCSANYSYFWSTNYLRSAYYVTGLIEIPLAIFTLFVIIKITPPKMSNMKWPLVNSQIWNTNMDLMFTFYSGPYIYFPSASGLPLGILGEMGIGVKWQSYWGQVSVTLIGVSFVMLYECRQSQVATAGFKIDKSIHKICYYIANIIFSFLVYLPFYMNGNNQEELRKLVLKRIPCPTPEFFSEKTYVLLRGDEKAPFFSITTSMFVVISQALFFVSYTLYHLFYVNDAKLSKATKKLQRNFLGCVTIQFFCPIIIITLPIFYSLYADKYNYYNQAFNNNSMLLMSTHGLCGSFLTLFIYKPYRDFFLGLFIEKKAVESEEFSRTIANSNHVSVKTRTMRIMSTY